MKRSKVIDRVLNIVTILIAIIVIIIAISTITSAKVGYNSVFGIAGMNVLTESMEGDAEDSFNKGDMIYVKILKDEEKANLQVNDVITFRDNIQGVNALNTHRIIAIEEMDGQTFYFTKGDNNPGMDPQGVESSAVVGKYTGKRIPVLGSIVGFFRSSTGFMVLVVVPAFLVVIYALVRVILNFRKVTDEKLALAVEAAKASSGELSEEEKIQLRQQYLERMMSEAAVAENNDKPHADEDNHNT